MQQIGELAKQRANIILQGFDPVASGGFTQIPNVILTSNKLSSGAKLCYAMLLKYAWQNNCCFPGQERLGKDMSITDRMIRTHLKELEKVGYLKTQRRGLGKTNIYTLYAKIRQDRKKTSALDRK